MILAASRRAVLLFAFSTGLIALSVSGHVKAETVDGNRVVMIDGDTIAIGRERIRILNIDTPETFRSRCESELKVGLEAKARLASLLRVGFVSIEREGRDKYGRTLARISAGGRDVGEILIREGLAVRWKPGRDAWDERAAHWCGGSRR